MRRSWLENAYLHCTLFRWAILTHKVGQTDLVLVYDVGLCVQDYKCLCAGVTMCATIVAQKSDFYILTRDPGKTGQTGGESVSWCIHVRCTYDVKFVTVGL